MYTEVVVLRKNAPGVKVLKMVLGALTVICLAVGITMFYPLLVGAVIFGLLFWKLSQSVDIEFQYNLMEDDFDIDKVIGNSKRKHILTVKTGQIVMVAPIDSPELSSYESWSTLDVSAKEPDKKPYAMICHVDGAKKRILIQMNEALLRSLKRQLGSKVLTA